MLIYLMLWLKVRVHSEFAAGSAVFGHVTQCDTQTDTKIKRLKARK